MISGELDKRFWPEPVRKMRASDPALRSVIKAFYKAADRVVTEDTEGRAVTTDLYSLGLNAAKRHKVHPVRLFSAIIDIAWGCRDHARGPKVVHHPAYASWIQGEVQW